MKGEGNKKSSATLATAEAQVEFAMRLLINSVQQARYLVETMAGTINHDPELKDLLARYLPHAVESARGAEEVMTEMRDRLRSLVQRDKLVAAGFPEEHADATMPTFEVPQKKGGKA